MKPKLVVFDFDGVITNGNVVFNENGNILKSYNVKDGLGIKLLKEKGIKTGVISAYKDNVSQKSICDHLNIDFISIGFHHKLEVLTNWCKEEHISLHDVAYIGDDINDIPVLTKVGVSGCPNDAHPKCKEVVTFISSKNGGEGCFREFIEFILDLEWNKPTPLVIDEIKQEFNYQINNIDIKEIEIISNSINQCKGNIYFCGIGKSGNIANHCSDLLKSISINCFYLNIMNALHGDIGTLNDEDIIIMFSKSGNTKELIDILPYFQKRKSKVIGICCDKNSKFKELCDITIETPFKNEISGEINKIPTNSYMSHLLFCNILVSLLKKNISADIYKENHPAGSIGKNLTKVKDNMIYDYPKIILETSVSLFEILLKMTNKKIGCCFFVDKNDILLGILTDGDIRRLLIKTTNLQTITLEHINTKYVYETDIEKYYCDIIKSHLYIPILSVDKKLISVLYVYH